MKKRDWRPTPSQEILLRAVLGEGERAVKAWREWMERIDMDRLDPGSFRLLPLLHENLKAAGVDDPRLALYRGVARHFWYRNRILFHRASLVLAAFQQRSIPALVLKGGALIGSFYRHGGLRPMGDFDVLVPFSRAREAAAVLREQGWRPAAGLPEEPDDVFLAVLARHHFMDTAGFSIDLHWSLYRENTSFDSDDEFWRGALPHTILGVPCRRLQPADQLLHVCKHGLEWDPTPTVRWVVDAARILTVSEVCWERFLEQTARLSFGPWLHASLHYLKTQMELPIPEEVLKTLARLRRPYLSRMEYLGKSRRYEILGDMPMLWCDYRRFRNHSDMDDSKGAFRRFLCRRWDKDSGMPLLVLIGRKLARRMKAGLLPSFSGGQKVLMAGRRLKEKRLQEESRK